MARQRRPHLPGACYHITTRTQGKCALFTPDVSSEVIAILGDSFIGNDALLVALAVMPTHLHLVIRQGRTTLGRALHPLLTRIACLMQRRHELEDHVFGDRYFAEPIHTPDHLRTAIAYVHLNPVRAGLCKEPGDFACTSHKLYTHGKASWASERLSEAVAHTAALPLFATGKSRALPRLRRDYRAYIDWRIRRDAAERSGSDPTSIPEPRLLHDAEAIWSREFSPLFRSPERTRTNDVSDLPAARVPEPSEVAAAVIAELATGTPIDHVRSRYGGPAMARVRRTIIERLDAFGYTGVQIAAWLRIDASRVSRALASSRGRCRS